jgi:hypothetical protein
VSLSPTGNTITVTYEEVFDVPEAGTYDVGEFPAVNPDEPYGVSEELPTLDEALSTASARWGAHPDRYVNEGMLGHEYEAYKRG